MDQGEHRGTIAALGMGSEATNPDHHATLGRLKHFMVVSAGRIRGTVVALMEEGVVQTDSMEGVLAGSICHIMVVMM
jgi:hypothetical protein